jgi:hypothetical protein
LELAGAGATNNGEPLSRSAFSSPEKCDIEPDGVAPQAFSEAMGRSYTRLTLYDSALQPEEWEP